MVRSAIACTLFVVALLAGFSVSETQPPIWESIQSQPLVWEDI
jgi:hypothetical protein